TPPYQHLRTAKPCILSGFLSEARLAYPRLADDHHQRCLAIESSVDRCAQRAHLLGAPDELSPSQTFHAGWSPAGFELTLCGLSPVLCCGSGFSARPIWWRR